MPRLTVYGGYSESNRAPTPLELGCSNPSKPCLIEGALVADPPLKQVVAQDLRGRACAATARSTTAGSTGRLGAFRTDRTDDIINVASVIQGRGVFQNVAATRRQGLEAGAQYHRGPWLALRQLQLHRRDLPVHGDIASPNNPLADADGNIHVTPGKRIPGIPRASVQGRRRLRGDAGVEGRRRHVAVGSQYFVGDDANQNAKLPAYWVTNLHTSYQLTKKVRMFGLVNNLFNQRYYPTALISIRSRSRTQSRQRSATSAR